MRILALDTATLSLSAALVELDPSGEVRSVREADEATRPGQHSVRLPGVLLDLLEEAGVALSEVDGLVAGLGPGSFTGLRTGLATLKGLAYGSRRPLVGAGSLAAMARQAADLLPPGTLLVPTLDARRAQVYAGFFRLDDGRLVEVSPEAVLGPEELLERMDHLGTGALFGQGAAAYPSLSAHASEAALPATPPAVGLARLGAPGLGAWDPAAVLSLVPRYVRRSEAEINLAAGRLRVPGPPPKA